MMGNQKLRLVVIPSDSITSYEKAGFSSWLETYYNPQKMFDQVFALSLLEKGERKAYGMTIIGLKKKDFLSTLNIIRPHVVRAYGGFWPADLACRYRLKDVPVLVSLHDPTPTLLNRSVRYADLVICMSKAVKNQAIVSGINERHIRILPNRVDTKIFYPIKDKEALQFLENRFRKGMHILHVGRKSYEKNLDTLISSLRFLPQDYSCVFVGPGDTTPYKNLASQIGVNDRCFWVESVKNEELPRWYSWCDCMCTPSRWEGFGIVFIEAAACSTAIITSNIAPMNEYLTHNVSACLVKEYENPKELSKAIRNTCENPVYRRRISDGAMNAAKPFERHIVDAAESVIYREALELEPLTLSTVDKLKLSIWKTYQGIAILSNRTGGVMKNHLIGPGGITN